MDGLSVQFQSALVVGVMAPSTRNPQHSSSIADSSPVIIIFSGKVAVLLSMGYQLLSHGAGMLL